MRQPGRGGSVQTPPGKPSPQFSPALQGQNLTSASSDSLPSAAPWRRREALWKVPSARPTVAPDKDAPGVRRPGLQTIKLKITFARSAASASEFLPIPPSRKTPAAHFPSTTNKKRSTQFLRVLIRIIACWARVPQLVARHSALAAARTGVQPTLAPENRRLSGFHRQPYKYGHSRCLSIGERTPLKIESPHYDTHAPGIRH